MCIIILHISMFCHFAYRGLLIVLLPIIISTYFIFYIFYLPFTKSGSVQNLPTILMLSLNMAVKLKIYECKQTFHKHVGCIISFKEHKFQFSFNMLSHLKGKSFHYPSYLFFAVSCRIVLLVSNSKANVERFSSAFFQG